MTSIGASGRGECVRVREVLWPLDGPRAWVEGEEQARAHLERCPACRAFFRHDALIGQALRRVEEAEPVPADLHERVYRALGSEGAVTRESRTGAARSRGRVALVLGAVVGASVALLALPGSSRDGSAFARDFLSRAVQQRSVEGADPAAVSAFFVQEFGQAIEPRRIADVPLVRAMICLIDGRRAAMVEYVADGHTVAHYRIPLEGGGGRRVSGVRTEFDHGIHAVRWSDARFEHALVSDLPPRRLETLAREGFEAR